MIPPPEPANFVKTSVAEHVLNVLSTTQRARLIVSIEGPPGVGKSTAAQHYAAGSNTVWYFAVRRDTSSTGSLFRELSAAFTGISDQRSTDNFRSLAMAARWASDREGIKPLLILDEAQNLNADALEMLRALYDEGGLSLALVGNHTFADRFNRERKALTASPQFRSRLNITVDLQAVEAADAAAVALAHGITDAALIKQLGQIARGPRGLRIIEGVSRLGAELCQTGNPDPADHRAALAVLHQS